MKRYPVFIAAVACLGLGACSEKPQSGASHKSDGQAFQGPASAYTAPGWKPGDQTSWQTQLRARAQGQNEYSRASAQ
jgi:hypothetical protein